MTGTTRLVRPRAEGIRIPTPSDPSAWVLLRGLLLGADVHHPLDPELVDERPVLATLTPAIGSDADAQPDPLTFEVVSPVPPSAGTLGPVTGSTVTFSPAPDFIGSTSFTFRVRDGGPSTIAAWSPSNVETVAITVSSSNDPPVADSQSVTTPEDTGVDITLAADDPEAEPLTFTAQQPGHGSVSCTDTACSFTPSSDFVGDDSFAFTATDPGGLSDTVTVLITVSAVNDAPVAVDALVDVIEDSSSDVVLAASDVEDATLDYTAGSEPRVRLLRRTPVHLHPGAGLQRHRLVHVHGDRRRGSERLGDGHAAGAAGQRRARSPSARRSRSTRTSGSTSRSRAPTSTAIPLVADIVVAPTNGTLCRRSVTSPRTRPLRAGTETTPSSSPSPIPRA
jgi:Bacterial Ig domain/Bacterial cadherin-like domain